jgi:putative transposase
MGLRRRSTIEGANIFFVTTSLKNHQPLFSSPKTRDDIETFLFEFFPDYADKLMGYVIMPSHIHLLVGCLRGGPQLSRFVQSFKSLSARKFFFKSVWEKRFDDLIITSAKQFQIKLNYIHDNPVRKGYVSNPVDWKWSSARFWILGQEHSLITKSWDWTP